MNNIFVNTRSSIKITGTKTIYFDPLDIAGEVHDADMVFVKAMTGWGIWLNWMEKGIMPWVMRMSHWKRKR